MSNRLVQAVRKLPSSIYYLLTRGGLEHRLAKLVLFCAVAMLVFYHAMMPLVRWLSTSSAFHHSFVKSQITDDVNLLQYKLDHKPSGTNDFDIIDTWNQSDSHTRFAAITESGSVIYPFALSGNIKSPINDNEYDVAELSFSGNRAVTAYVINDYDYVFFALLLIGMRLLSVVLFLAIFIWGIRRRIVYILQLEEEISHIEQGDLDTKITIDGEDELASLAEKMNDVRLALAERVHSEEKALVANRDLITTISHDLRTPLTSLLLYTQILKAANPEDLPKMIRYLDKIDNCALQIKSLSDSLFEHFTVGARQQERQEEGPFAIVMRDLISNLVATLENSGFRVVATGTAEGADMPVNIQKLDRVIDNILSNMLKYADRTQPIRINATSLGNKWQVRFSNTIAPDFAQQESTGIGIKNMRRLMAALGGTYTEKTTIDGIYISTLIFPIRPKNTLTTTNLTKDNSSPTEQVR